MIETSKSLFLQAKKSIPGGVNSPVRAFKSVGGIPIFMDYAKDAYLFDVDGNKYIDYINSWGPMILGHRNLLVENALIETIRKSCSFGTPTKKELEVAELIRDMMPSIEMVRMVNSGTEATMSAIRLARGYTNRDKILKFEGCYHGHSDSFLISAGSGVATMGIPDSLGVTKSTAKDTLTAPYNDIEKLRQIFENNELAAVIVEPVAGNMGCVLPDNNFLSKLRSLCDQHSTILIFDEVMTGFRLAKGGAQQIFNITPDLTTLGKIIGGGLPVGAYGGKKEIMRFVAPQGAVYQAGTLSGNPIAMVAGHTQLSYLNDNPKVYTKINESTRKLTDGFKKCLDQHHLKFQINRIGSMFSLFFVDTPVYDYESAKQSDLTLFGKYFHFMLNKGIYLPPSQFESLFISTAIEEEHIAHTVASFNEFLDTEFLNQ